MQMNCPCRVLFTILVSLLIVVFMTKCCSTKDGPGKEVGAHLVLGSLEWQDLVIGGGLEVAIPLQDDRFDIAASFTALTLGEGTDSLTEGQIYELYIDGIWVFKPPTYALRFGISYLYDGIFDEKSYLGISSGISIYLSFGDKIGIDGIARWTYYPSSISKETLFEFRAGPSWSF